MRNLRKYLDDPKNGSLLLDSLFQELRERELHLIDESLRNNVSVIVDSWLLKPVDYAKYQERYDVVEVLVDCPFV